MYSLYQQEKSQKKLFDLQSPRGTSPGPEHRSKPYSHFDHFNLELTEDLALKYKLRVGTFIKDVRNHNLKVVFGRLLHRNSREKI